MKNGTPSTDSSCIGEALTAKRPETPPCGTTGPHGERRKGIDALGPYGSSLMPAMTTPTAAMIANRRRFTPRESFKTRNVGLGGDPFRDRVADHGDGRFGLPFVETGFAKQLGGSVGVEGSGHRS